MGWWSEPHPTVRRLVQVAGIGRWLRLVLILPALASARPSSVIQVSAERPEPDTRQHVPGMYQYVIQIDGTPLVRKRMIIPPIKYTFLCAFEGLGHYPLKRTVVDVTSGQQQTLLHNQMHHLIALHKAQPGHNTA
uniref:Uncharacterized protein n=1 Tax=Anopheles minimus TaxID=112268 RepID=A0A182W5P4_9DIPT